MNQHPDEGTSVLVEFGAQSNGGWKPSGSPYWKFSEWKGQPASFWGFIEALMGGTQELEIFLF